MFSLEEAKKSGVFICGMTGSGKSNWGYNIADKLVESGAVVTVFAPTPDWRRLSSIPYYWIIPEETLRIPVFSIQKEQDISIIYDTSLLTWEDMRLVTLHLCQRDWNFTKNFGNKKIHYYIFEEGQTIMPSGTSRRTTGDFAPFIDLVTRGRNFNMRFVIITQRPALMDVSPISQSGQQYWGYMDEENDMRKAKNYLGRDNAKWLNKLETGEFFYRCPRRYPTRIQTPEFKSSVTPQLWMGKGGE